MMRSFALATLPLRRWWSLTPRVAYGYANATDQQIKGQMLSAMLTKSIFLSHVGRGWLTLATWQATAASCRWAISALTIAAPVSPCA
jgi:hypothetical protein